MGRRKKEPAEAHRKSIAKAAEMLFAKRGIEATTMDDIAKEAGYSKATLYVYFTKKEEIVGLLTLESMRKLHDYIESALQENGQIRGAYRGICGALWNYRRQFPFYFHTVLGEISVNFENSDCSSVERETFDVGEKINGLIAAFIQRGINAGEFRPDIPILPTVFSFWAMLSGLIVLAANKKEYMEGNLGMSEEDFLEFGFETLYWSIASGGGEK